MTLSRRMAVSAILLLASLLSCGTPSTPEQLHTDSVSLVIGDKSFQARFGRPATVHDDEALRVRVHLEYVLELLRQRPTEHLSPDARAARTRNLDRLEAYIRRGEFPRNDDHPDARRPTFIDSRGRICAVGYLLEQELGREAAAAIAAGFKYAFVREIDSPVLTQWAATTGLEREELEMIQPTYSVERDYGPFFSLLEQHDGRGHLSLAPGFLFDRKGDGVPVRLDLSMAFMGRYGLGPYATVSLTKLTGAPRSASALSNIDLGMVWARSVFSDAWLVLRGGLLLPTGDEDEVGSSLNATVAAKRPTQAVLFQPGALGGRVGASMLLGRAFCSSCSLRLDAGLDAYSPFYKSLQFSPRWGAGFAYSVHPFVATLEVAGARYAETPSSKSELHHTIGGSFRFIISQDDSLQPGISLSIPLEDRIKRCFLGLDLTMRY
ncbi:hypothetical protein [Archangium lansingense]|uniref:Uncharacterized protein n=1 Tax=Archangium lansingense TaxID=2995310 RepID=A0ABT4AR06_9BACT|nr:hypothetical protein [Archangium lansinium]MCY1083599.1 hypothetical protein [Archangium lansinium]